MKKNNLEIIDKNLLRKIAKYESDDIYNQLPISWHSAKNHKVYNREGKVWIDFTSSIFVTNIGHCNKEVERAIINVTKKLSHAYSYPTQYRADLSEYLIKISPSNLQKVILLTTGSEAIERAIKLSKIYGMKKNKKYIVCWNGNYHGKTQGSQMLSGDSKQREWIGLKDKTIIRLPFPNHHEDPKKQFEKHINIIKKNKINLSEIASFFIETYQGWAGIFYPKEYIKQLRNLCDKKNSLMIFDEIQSGFGRTGKLFGFQHYGVKADLVVCAKAISNGLPLSAIIGKKSIINLDPSYTSTHGGHPICCAASLATLKFIKSNNLINKSAIKGKIVKDFLYKLRDKYPKHITEIHGHGLVWGVVTKKQTSSVPDVILCNQIVKYCYNNGLLILKTNRGSLKLAPPLTIPISDLNKGLRIIEDAFSENQPLPNNNKKTSINA